MSLVLALYTDSIGIIASDGRSCYPAGDGQYIPFDDNSFKVIAPRSDLAFGATGVTDLTNHMRWRVTQYVHEHFGSREVFADLERLIPNWAKAAWATDPSAILSMLLVGHDPRVERIRCLNWGTYNGFINEPWPEEEDSIIAAIGWPAVTEKAVPMLRQAMQPEWSVPTIKQAMERILRELAERHHEISGAARVHVVSPLTATCEHLADIDANNRALVDFSQGGHTAKHLDNIPDGPTYGRALASRLNAGKPWIDFSEGIHSNKHLGNISDDAGSDRRAATANEKTGGGRGYDAIRGDLTYKVDKYHKSGVVRNVSSTPGGSTASTSWVTVATLPTIHIPPDATQYKGTLRVSAESSPATFLRGYGRLKIGALVSNEIVDIDDGGSSTDGTVTVTGLTGDTDISVEVQYKCEPGGLTSAGGYFTQIDAYTQGIQNIV